MPDSRQTIRIFISSPGDVAEEREKARRVIEELQRKYSAVTLQPMLWEDFALPATATCQEGIDYILNVKPVDISVFVLWSRLGTQVGPEMKRTDGTPYRSGTEREFDLMLGAFEQSGRKHPLILAYNRDDLNGFKQRLAEAGNSADLEELIAQRKLAESFIREQFQDAEGHNFRAYHSYREPVGFAHRLRAHLRQAIDDLLGADEAVRWTDEPYRALEAFDIRHAAIFRGRDEETCDLLDQLHDQASSGCAFVVIIGASGSGKSSLARAGVAASLVQQIGDEMVKQWRPVAFVPALETGDLIPRLIQALASAVPEQQQSDAALADIAKLVKNDPADAVRPILAPMLARAEEAAGGPVRILLILDQMEELWTGRRIAPEDRNSFMTVVEALARSGLVSVLATLRSDFYPHAQQMPAFMRMKGERGHFDLLPPGTAALRRLIIEPARLAGLSFERDERTGRTLDEAILQDAEHDPGALPLLQYALSELYRQRDEKRRLLTLAAYRAMGGVEGALGKRAQMIFDGLPPESQAAMSEILPLLISVDVAGEQAAVRRRAPMDALTATPARRALVESLIAARFLTTDHQDRVQVASFSHEALLRRWERVAAWVAVNREHLRLRARVEQSEQRWEQQARDESLLLPPGLPLEEARQLLTQAPHLLGTTTADYIRASIEADRRRIVQARRRRRVLTTVLSVLTLAAIAAAIYALGQRNDAVEATVAAENNADRAKLAEQQANKNAADATAQRQAAEDLASKNKDLADAAAAKALEAAQQSRLAALQAKIATENAEKLKTQLQIANALRMQSDGLRLADSDPEKGVMLALAAIERMRTLGEPAPVTMEDTLRTALAHTPGIGLGTADDPLLRGQFSPRGRWFVLPKLDPRGKRTLAVWDVGGGARNAKLVRSLAIDSGGNWFSPDDHWLVTEIPQFPRAPPGSPAPAPGAMSVPDTPATLRPGVYLWDLQGIANPAVPAELIAEQAVNDAAFSPDGRWFALGTGLIKAPEAPPAPTVPKAPAAPALPAAPAPPAAPAAAPPAPSAMRSQFLRRVAYDAVAPPAAASGQGVVFMDLSQAKHSAVQILALPESGFGVQVAFSSDNQWLAGVRGETVFLWRVGQSAGDISKKLEAKNEFAVTSFLFSHDSRSLAVGLADGQIRVWDLSSPALGDAPPATFKSADRSSVTLLGFSNDDKRLVMESRANDLWGDRSVRIIDLASAKSGSSPAAIAVRSFQPGVSRDGKWLVTQDGPINLRSLDGTDSRSSPSNLPESLNVGAVEFSYDCRWLFGLDGEGNIYRWDLSQPSSSPAVVSGLGRPVDYFEVNRDATLVAVARLNGDQSAPETMRLFDVRPGSATLEPLSASTARTLRRENDWFFGCCLSPDSRWLAFADEDSTVRVLDLNRGATQTISGFNSQPRGLKISDDGNLLTAVCADGTIHLYRLSQDQPPSDLNLDRQGALSEGGWISETQISSDNRWVAAPFRQGGFAAVDPASKKRPSHTVGIWSTDPATSDPWPNPKRLISRNGLGQFMFSPDGRWLATAGQKGIQLNDMQSPSPADAATLYAFEGTDIPPPPGGDLLPEDEAPSKKEFAFGANSRWLIAGSGRELRAWDLTKADKAPRVYPLQGDDRVQFLVSENGRWLMTRVTSGSLQIRDLALADPIPEPTLVLDTAPYSGFFDRQLALSNDGHFLAAGRDNEIRIADLRESSPFAQPQIIDRPFNGGSRLQFLSDGRMITFTFGDRPPAIEITVSTIELDALMRVASRVAGRKLTSEESAPYEPGAQRPTAVVPPRPDPISKFVR